MKLVGAGAVAGTALSIELPEDQSLGEYIDRHTARFLLNPRDYLNPRATEDLDIEEFADVFHHRTDAMNGAYDVLKPVEKTIASKTGDCEDYSAVAASWILQHKQVRPKIQLQIPEEPQLMGHINVTDGQRVYDNGNIYNVSQYGYDVRSDFDVIYKIEVN